MKHQNKQNSKGSSPAKSKPAARKRPEMGKKKEIVNPFDKFANARKKHEVLNRRVKGEDRNVGRARARAIDERKTKLLKDYNTSKKSNMFLDRRFGESDANISLEEKMFMRFQQERVKKVRNSSLFNLDGNDTEVLTHKGQALADTNMDDRDYFSSDEEGGGKLDKEVVNKLHFGGGMVESGNNRSIEDMDNGSQRKDKLSALQEIVMKSKLHKLQRKEAKEEQEEERDKLDKAYDDLFSSSQVQLDKPIGKKYRRGEDEEDALDAYDVSLREMAFEGKAQPSDRTKTPEEIALAEQKRIEELEKARLKRMRQVDKPEDEEEDKNEHRTASGVVVSSTAKKRKHVTDDQIDSNAVLTPRERKAAKNAKMAEKFGASSSGDALEDEEYGDSDEDEESEEESEGSDEEDDGDDDAEQDEEYSDNDDEDNEEGDGEEEEDEYASDEPLDYDPQPEDDKKKNKKGKKSSDGSDDESDTDSDEDEAEDGGRFNRRRPKKPVQYVEDGVNIHMPYQIKCPVDLDSFDELVDKYVKQDTDLFAMVDRILAWNSVNLPGAQGAENRNLMHNFLDILLKHFVRVGDSLSNAQNDEAEVKRHLDYLTSTIFTLCQTLGEGCVPLWGRTLKILQSQLQKRLRDYSLGNRDSCWPSLGRLLLLQQLGHVFSVTDLKNEIVSPATLFLCQCLAQCPVSTTKDVVSGLLCCSIVLGITAETQRFVPELLSFVHSLVAQFAASNNNLDKKQFQATFNVSSLSWLRARASECKSSSSKISWSCFSSKPADSESHIAGSILSTTYTLIDSIMVRSGYSNSLPELLDPILSTLRALRPQDAPALTSFQQRHVETLEKILSQSKTKKESRVPLQWRKSVTVSIDMKTPRFQLDYTFKKDTDPDHERVQLKQLNRQLKREKKAAMRELRRDSAFIDSERFKEVTAAKEKRKAERVKNYGWMEEQQATVNQQVRQGKGLMKGGGSSIAKKSRVKRL